MIYAVIFAIVSGFILALPVLDRDVRRRNVSGFTDRQLFDQIKEEHSKYCWISKNEYNGLWSATIGDELRSFYGNGYSEKSAISSVLRHAAINDSYLINLAIVTLKQKREVNR